MPTRAHHPFPLPMSLRSLRSLTKHESQLHEQGGALPEEEAQHPEVPDVAVEHGAAGEGERHGAVKHKDGSVHLHIADGGDEVVDEVAARDGDDGAGAGLRVEEWLGLGGDDEGAGGGGGGKGG